MARKNKYNKPSPAFVQGCCLYLFIFIALSIKAFIEWFSQNPFLAIIVLFGGSALILYEISIFAPKNNNGKPNYTYYQQNRNNRNNNDNNSDSIKKLPKDNFFIVIAYVFFPVAYLSCCMPQGIFLKNLSRERNINARKIYRT